MIKKLIIHIGLHKTGTTSIQHTLYKKRNILNKEDMSYPVFKFKGNDIANHSWPLLNLILESPENYHLNKSNLLSHDDIEALKLKTRDILKKESKHKSTMIISGEGLSIVDQKSLIKLKDELSLLSTSTTEIEFHYFVRNKIKFIQSVIQERLKGGVKESKILSQLSSNIPNNDYIYKEYLHRVFPNAAIHRHDFDLACKYENGLEEYFFKEVLKVDFTRFTNESSEINLQNTSLSCQAYELLKTYLDNCKIRTDIPQYGSEYKRNIDLISQLEGERFSLNKRHEDLILNNAKRSGIYEEWETLLKYNPTQPLTSIWKNVESKRLIAFMNGLTKECQQIFVDYFRDQAICYEHTDIENAYQLMLTAYNFRPNGTLIAKKLEEYSKSINIADDTTRKLN